MKRNVMVKPALILLAVFIFGACHQDAVFDTISNETAPVEPRIKGSPTNMVLFNGKAYVGQGDTLNSYTAAGWNKGNDIPRKPGGNMYGHALASTDAYLYAVASGKVFRINAGGTSWAQVSGDSIQNVFSAGDAGGTVFAGRQADATTYDIYYLNNTNPSSLIRLQANAGDIGVTGAASSGTTLYVSTDKGIYCFTPALASSGTILWGTNIKGIINTGSSTVVAVAANGDFYQINGTSANRIGNAGGPARPAALAVWQSSTGSLLLVGVENSANDRGYREITLGSGIASGNGREPGGGGTSTLADRDAYRSSLKNHLVSSIFQAPNGVLFASTVNQGLWSCRGKWQAED